MLLYYASLKIQPWQTFYTSQTWNNRQHVIPITPINKQEQTCLLRGKTTLLQSNHLDWCQTSRFSKTGNLHNSSSMVMSLVTSPGLIVTVIRTVEQLKKTLMKGFHYLLQLTHYSLWRQPLAAFLTHSTGRYRNPHQQIHATDSTEKWTSLKYPFLPISKISFLTHL